MKGIIIKVNEKNISEDMLIIDLKNIASAINSSTLSVKNIKIMVGNTELLLFVDDLGLGITL